MSEYLTGPSRQIVETLIGEGAIKIWYDDRGSLKGEIYDPVETSSDENIVLTKHMLVSPEGKFTGEVFRFPESCQLEQGITDACNKVAEELLDGLTQPVEK